MAEYDYAAEMARYSDRKILSLLGQAEALAADLAQHGEEWANVTENLHRLRAEHARRTSGWRRVYSFWELFDPRSTKQPKASPEVDRG